MLKTYRSKRKNVSNIWPNKETGNYKITGKTLPDEPKVKLGPVKYDRDCEKGRKREWKAERKG